MTYTTQTIPTSTPPQPRVSRRSTWLLAAGLAAIMLVAVSVGVVVFRGNNSSTGTAASQQLAAAQLTSVQQSCQQWAGTSTPTVGKGSSGSAWCTTMTDWMGQQLRSQHMSGAMMWGSATALQTTCQQWMATGSGATSGTASPARCGQMATWMASHMGDWRNWMTSGNMMGR